MAFRNRRAFALRPVTSLKHVVDTNGGISAAAVSTTDVMQAVDGPQYLISPQQINTGANMKWIFLNVQVIQEVAAGGIDNIYLAVYKNVGNNTALAVNLDSIGTSDRKRFVIHQEMVMTGTALTAASAVPKTLFKGVIRIPKSLQRFGLEDRLQVLISHRTGEATQVTNFCLQCIYKELNV